MMIVRIRINVLEELVCLLVVSTSAALMRNVFHKVIVVFVGVLMSTMAIQGLNVRSRLAYQIPEDLNVNEILIVDPIKSVMMNVALIHAELLMHVDAVRIASHKITELFVNVSQDTVAIQRLPVIHRSRQTNNVVQIQNVHYRNLASTCIASIHAIVVLMPIVPSRITIQFASANLVTLAMLWLIASNLNAHLTKNVPMTNNVPATNAYIRAS